jgi:hypothetical protein
MTTVQSQPKSSASQARAAARAAQEEKDRAEYIRRAVEAAPPLSPARRERLRTMIHATRRVAAMPALGAAAAGGAR